MLSLATLLRDTDLRLRLLVAGPPQTLNAPVTWVHGTELADPSGYIHRGELVMTNGLWMSEVTPTEFVGSVRRVGARGVVFGLRVAQPTTPAELVSACRNAELPLAEIPIDVPFTAVSRAAAAVYERERHDVLSSTIQRGDALTNALSRGAGISGIIDVLRREHERPLVVIDRLGRLL